MKMKLWTGEKLSLKRTSGPLIITSLQNSVQPGGGSVSIISVDKSVMYEVIRCSKEDGTLPPSHDQSSVFPALCLLLLLSLLLLLLPSPISAFQDKWLTPEPGGGVCPGPPLPFITPLPFPNSKRLLMQLNPQYTPIPPFI